MHLRLIILKFLKEGEKTGYELIKIMEKECDWKPSPGSMYPHLADLAKKSLIKVKKVGRKKFYAITPRGSRELDKMKGEAMDMMDNISKKVNVFSSIFGMKLEMRKAISFVMSELKKGKIPFGQLGKDMMVFRLLFLKKAMNEKNHKKMHKILKEAHEKIEKI